MDLRTQSMKTDFALRFFLYGLMFLMVSLLVFIFSFHKSYAWSDYARSPSENPIVLGEGETDVLVYVDYNENFSGYCSDLAVSVLTYTNSSDTVGSLSSVGHFSGSFTTGETLNREIVNYYFTDGIDPIADNIGLACETSTIDTFSVEAFVPPDPENATTTLAAIKQMHADMVFGLAILIFFAAIIFWGFFFNSFIKTPR